MPAPLLGSIVEQEPFRAPAQPAPRGRIASARPHPPFNARQDCTQSLEAELPLTATEAVPPGPIVQAARFALTVPVTRVPAFRIRCAAPLGTPVLLGPSAQTVPVTREHARHRFSAQRGVLVLRARRRWHVTRGITVPRAPFALTVQLTMAPVW